MALVPLGEKGSIGLLALGSADRDRFHPGMSTEFLARMADLIADALQRRALDARAAKLSPAMTPAALEWVSALPALPELRAAPLRAHRRQLRARSCGAGEVLRPRRPHGLERASTASTCARFAAHSHAGGLSPRSIQRRLSAVRSFFQFLVRDSAAARRSERIAHNPAHDVRAPKSARKLPQTLDADQMARLLEIPAGDALDRARPGA